MSGRMSILFLVLLLLAPWADAKNKKKQTLPDYVLKAHTVLVGPSEDTFEVYRGGVEDPLDTSPVWRYMAKDALNAPRVSAVEQFQKAITESEKQRQQKP